MRKKPRTVDQTIPTMPNDVMDLTQACLSSVPFDEIIHYQEFADLLDPGTEEELAKFAAGVRCDQGFRDPVVIWKETKELLDGHRRRRVWEKYFHSDPAWAPKVVEISFPDRQAAELWIIRNQMTRRNLTDIQRIDLVRKYQPFIAANAAENRKRGVRLKSDEGQKSVDTNAELAGMAQMGRDKFCKGKKVLDNGTPELVQAVRKGKIKIHAAAQAVALPPEEQNEIARAAESSNTRPKKSKAPRPPKAAREIDAPPVDAASAKVQPCELPDMVNTIGRYSQALLRDVSQGATNLVDSPAKIAVLRSAMESLKQIPGVNNPQPPSSASSPETATVPPADPQNDKSPADQSSRVLAETSAPSVASGTISAKETAEADLYKRVSALKSCVEWAWNELDPLMDDIRTSAPVNREAIEKQYERFHDNFANLRAASIQFFRECKARKNGTDPHKHDSIPNGNISTAQLKPMPTIKTGPGGAAG